MRNSPSRLRLLVAACALAAAPTFAAESAAAKLQRLEAETAVLKARARKAEVQAQIANRNAEIAARNAEARRIAEQPTASARAPVLRGIEGVGSTLYATLEMPDGGSADVRAGDTLADGSRVVAVRPGEVVLQAASKRPLRLRLGSGPAHEASSAAPGGAYPAGTLR